MKLPEKFHARFDWQTYRLVRLHAWVQNVFTKWNAIRINIRTFEYSKVRIFENSVVRKNSKIRIFENSEMPGNSKVRIFENSVGSESSKVRIFENSTVRKNSEIRIFGNSGDPKNSKIRIFEKYFRM